MRYVPPQHWWIALAAYAGAGLIVGVTAVDLPALVVAMGLRPGWGRAVAINLLLPGSMTLITAWYPRVRTAWIGTVVLTGAFGIGFLLRQEWRIWLWSIGLPLKLGHPILLAGMVGDGVIGTIVALVIGPFRRVGNPPDPDACKACGYSLAGLEDRVCPECGTADNPAPRDPASVTTVSQPRSTTER